MLKEILIHFSPKRKLLKSIRKDHANWRNHFETFNRQHRSKADPIKLKFLGREIYERNLKQILSDYHINKDESSELQQIRSFFQLSEREVNAIKSKYAKRTVNALSQAKLSDNILTDDELKEIEEFAAELNISQEQVRLINQKNSVNVYEDALKNIVADRIVTFEEQADLKQLAKQLNINPDNGAIDRRLSENYDYLVLLNALDHGYLPEVKTNAVVVQRNEVAHIEVGASLLINKVVTTGYTGASAGVSLRVMKGVSYRVGSSRSRPIRQEITNKYSGVLVITSKRVVFAASQKSFSIPYTQLISFDPYSDGIGFQKNNRDFILQFNDSKVAEVVFKVIANAVNQN